MAEAMVIADSRAAARVSEQTPFSPTGEVLRDIARGGISGAIVRIAVGGLGGRVVMRIVAILHPDAVGALTENGNRIGDISVGGTLFLVLFGLISCALAGALWVIVRPWIQGHTGARALLTAVIAITIGTPLLIIGRNPDFVILDHDPRVVQWRGMAGGAADSHQRQRPWRTHKPCVWLGQPNHAKERRLESARAYPPGGRQPPSAASMHAAAARATSSCHGPAMTWTPTGSSSELPARTTAQGQPVRLCGVV